MRILATCQYGWPEPYPSLYPMEEMAKRGHYVHAITGTPNYPMGEVFKGYEHNKIKEEDHNGIHITHVPVVPRKNDAIHRLLNYHSYPITAKRKILSLKEEYDVIFANQSSPVMMVEPAIAYGKRRNIKVVMYCMDLWPASLCVGGVKKDSKLYRYYFKRSARVYQSVDVLMITSRMFKEYFVSEFGIDEKKIIYLPQYALSDFDDIPETPKDKETTDFVFAGNVGVAQNLIVVLKAAEKIQGSRLTDKGKRILFHIVGNGQDLENLQKYAKDNKINNVVFHGRKPSEEMPKIYSMADAMIVSMLPDPLISLTLAAKVQSYMAAGKPIIASADGETKNVIEAADCGLCAKAGDVSAFEKSIEEFIGTNNRFDYGVKAKKYYTENFTKDHLMTRLEKILMENC